MFLPSKLPSLGRAEETAEYCRFFAAKDRRDFIRRPNEIFAFLTFAVGVGGREEAAVRAGHLSQYVVECFLGNAPVQASAGRLVGIQIQAGEQCVVVEHLLEVGHQPEGVGRVAVEAASDLVVDAAAGHLLQGELQHLQGAVVVAVGVVAEEHFEGHWLREFGSIADAPVLVVEIGGQRRIGLVENVDAEKGVAAGQLGGAAHLLGQLPGNPVDLRPVGAVGAGRGLQKPGEPWDIVAVDRREVGAAEKGLAVGGEEDGHRPAAAARQHLDRLHVDGVQVGPFLPVHLDVDEILVHHGGDDVALEGLALHDVAPVAGGIADAEQDGLVLGPGPLQRLFAPGVPVDRVIGVLEQVGAGLVN